MAGVAESPVRSPFPFRTEKIFVGNLPPTATRALLQKHFSTYGKITDCVIMVLPARLMNFSLQINKDGSGRGFGFCEFESPESVDAVIEAWSRHFINGQWVEVKRASPENGLGKYASVVVATARGVQRSRPLYL